MKSIEEIDKMDNLESIVKSLVMDSLLSKATRVLTSDVIAEITAELVPRIAELFIEDEDACH
jgi:hypothetical protein